MSGRAAEATMEDPVIDPAELYHENSKLTRLDEELFQWFGFVSSAPALRDTLSRPFKVYRGKPRVDLPETPEALPPAGRGFDETILARRSERALAGPVPLAQVAKMLYQGYGLSRREAGSTPFRATPSAGGLYPLEVYLVAERVEGLEPGVYHYAPAARALELLAEGSRAERLGEITFAPEVLEGAAGAFVVSGFFERSSIKYRKRAYRFVLLEAGHLCQTLMLSACALGLGTLALGGFLDDELNELLGIDGLAEAALYVLPFGNPLP